MTADQTPVCPEKDFRDGLSDGDFWDHVLNRPCEYPDEPDFGDDADPTDVLCQECGAEGACAWDSEGRPLIHATNGDDE